MVTKEQIEKQLHKLLISKGVKDSELKKVTSELNGSEIVSIVQNGKSKQLNLTDFLKNNVDNNITIDENLDPESDRPVQNKTITKIVEEFLTEEEIKSTYVPKNQLEGTSFGISLNVNTFNTDTATKELALSGIVSYSANTLVANASGKPSVAKSNILPEKITITVYDYLGNVQLTQTIQDLKEGQGSRFTFPKIAYKCPSASSYGGSVKATIEYFGSHNVSTNYYFNYYKYFGPTSSDTVIDENSGDLIVKLRSKLAGGSKSYLGEVGLSNQKIVYAYPAILGKISRILDGNGWEITSGFDNKVITVNGISYRVYYTLDAVTASKAVFKFE